MAILSDRWIKNQCRRPEYVMVKPEGFTYFVSGPLTKYEAFALNCWNCFIQHVPKEDLANGITPNDFGDPYMRPVTEEELANWKPMIEPFIDHSVKEHNGSLIVHTEQAPGSPEEVVTGVDRVKRRVLSYGLSSYGYDARVAPEFRIFTNINSTKVDPLNFDENCYVEVEGDHCIIPPNSFALTRTMEYFRIPRGVLVTVLTKSTMARVGTHSLATPLEPGWEGQVTLEFANTTPLPSVLHAEMGGVQLLFYEGNEPCEVSYADRGGKYQGQQGIVNPRA